MPNPRKRSIVDANAHHFHQASADGQMGGDSFVDGQSTGLRRRRIGSQGDGDGAPSPNGVVAFYPHHGRPHPKQQRERELQEQKEQKSVVPLAMHLMRPFWHMSCGPECYPPGHPGSYGGYGSFEDEFFAGNVGNHHSPTPPRRNVSMTSLNLNGGVPPDAQNGSDGAGGERGVAQISNGNSNDQTPKRAIADTSSSDYVNHSPVSSISTIAPSPTVANPIIGTLAAYPGRGVSIEQILQEYTAACSIFGCASRINPGVLTALRFSLPTLRVSGNFFDADMLALAEVLLKHCNGALSYVRRLDFTIAGRQGKDRERGGKKGVRSHGAYALSKVLGVSEFIEEVYLTGNKIGPYGGTAIFEAAAQNASNNGRLSTLLMRGCRIGERGALVFAKDICAPPSEGKVDGKAGVGGGLRMVDLSANRIGFRGCFAIETALKERTEELSAEDIEEAQILVDLEGNLVFQEVMNCVTHGLGVLFGTVGTRLLRRQVDGLPPHYAASCAVYSASIIVLYTSSTLFHSFFALRGTKFIFQVFDKCAIYLLIAGSYTPFLMIALHHEPLWSLHLLMFIWTCAVSGILVEAFCRTWEHKSKFSLAMYLGMGWSCLICMPDLVEVVPKEGLALMVAGGLAYTGGVPFFVRNNNLDHSIWHMFVLAGSVFHWLCVYWYVAIP